MDTVKNARRNISMANTQGLIPHNFNRPLHHLSTFITLPLNSFPQAA